MFKKYTQIPLIARILIGIVIGALLGIIFPSWTWIDVLGKLFIGALKGIAPVLVFLVIMAAISGYEKGAENHFGTIIVLYLSATFLSAVAAVGASYLFPIKLVLTKGTAAQSSGAPESLGQIISDLLTTAVSNPVHAIINGDYLAILFWAVLLGVALQAVSKTTRTVVNDLSGMIGKVAGWIIQLAPFGIIGLIHESLVSAGLKGLVRYGQLILLLVGTMVFVYLVVYAIMVWFVTRQNPFPLVFWTLKVSGIPAFFTRSSAVNIPINLEACKDLGLNEKSYGVSIPLGGSANSGGAAITISVMTLAAAHTLGIQFSFLLALLLCFLTAISATGASGIAGGSLLLIPMACNLFGISNDIAMEIVGIGFVIGVIQDSVETAVNSASDLLFTAAAEYGDLRKAGKPINIKEAVKKANAAKYF
ncbi:proton glutamate symport protein [Ligilactobacillus salitolerans]|uniref:Serine/threonine transporter SstT n=1 Tax=Ligilactobacillus salitolerans TaxID=1808352 RepID=A0A401ISE6_9LACO|nr:serine/threonine transporter SstT [Ligilactobacillus salitolerans]GBG94460.1 proton glutamate symport protein [Ligilactobacillus salitolerans]